MILSANYLRHTCVLAALLCLALPISVGAEAVPDNKVVVGPHNLYLAEGVNALKAGEPERAVKLLKKGLKFTHGERDFAITLSNICAAYVLLEQYPRAIEYCSQALNVRPTFWRAHNNRALAYLGAKNYALAKQDIDAGFAMAPNAISLSKTRLRYENTVNPVRPVVIIDDSQFK